MMNKIAKELRTMNAKVISAILIFSLLFANETMANTEMADVMRSNGKIYVVVAVLVIIFTGLFVYLVMVDKKLSKLEKEIKDK